MFKELLWHGTGMIKIGQANKMICTRQIEFGALFSSFEEATSATTPDQELDRDKPLEILLPRKYVDPDLKVGDIQELFVCYDSEDRLVATTEWPFAMVGDFAHLKVKSQNRVGAFLDWGLGKDLLLPFSEQSREIRTGDYVIVYIYLDKTDRIAASMRLDRYLNKSNADFKEEQQVEALVVGTTPLGLKAIVNGTHWGLLYKNEIFERLTPGLKVKAYIKLLRPDGKIDLSLQKQGYQSPEPIAELILEKLKAQGGFLPLTDKTDPKRIYDLFGVSKKKYKMALGGLYKKRLVLILENGIELVK